MLTKQTVHSVAIAPFVYTVYKRSMAIHVQLRMPPVQYNNYKTGSFSSRRLTVAISIYMYMYMYMYQELLYRIAGNFGEH